MNIQHAERVGEHAELGAPERVVRGQRDLAVHRQRLELLRHVGDVVEVETDVDVALCCDRHAGLGVADHDDAFADAQEGVHDTVLVLGGHVHSGNVAEAHEPLGLPAERALVELDGLHVLVAGEPAEHRLTKLGDQAVAPVPPGARIGEHLARHRREAERIVEFPERDQPGIGGDGRAVEFELQPALERDPQLSPFRFTRRLVHPPPPR